MFCINCGAKLEEGARFCTSCGTPVEAAPETPPEQTQEPEARVEETAPAEPAQTEPVPEASAPETPAPEPPAPETPAAETPVWEEPAPEPPAPEEPPVPPRKKFNFKIPIIAAAAVVVIAIVALSFPALADFASRTFSKPADYYHKVEMNALDDYVESAGNMYARLLDFAEDSDDFGFSGAVELSLGKAARKLMKEAEVDEYLDWLDSAEYLDWLDSARIEVKAGRKDNLAGGELGVQLNKTKILSASVVSDLEEGGIYAQVPELSKDYVDLSGLQNAYMLYRLYRILPMSLDDLEDLFTDMLADAAVDGVEELLKELVKQLPSQKEYEKLMERYLRIAVESIEDVEKGRDTLSAGDYSAKYTTLEVEIDEDTLRTIAENVIQEMQKDKDLKKYIENVAVVIGYDDAYDDFLDMLEDLEENLDDFETDEKLVMTLYVNGSGSIVGREIKAGDTKIKMAAVSKGTKGGIEVNVKQSGSTVFSLAGEGKLSGTAINGELTLKVQGNNIASFKIEKLNAMKLKEGYLVGKITIKPSKQVLEDMSIPSSAESLVKKMSLTLDMNNAKNSTDVKISVNSDDSELVGVRFEFRKASIKLSPVRDAEEPMDWLENLSSGNVKAVIKNLKKAGLPSDIIDKIEDAVDYYL